MKKVSIFLVGVFPYCFMFDGLLMKLGVIKLPLSGRSYLFMMVMGVVLYVLARCGLKYLLKEIDRKKLAKLSLILKIVQVPAHLFNVVFCILFALTLFGIAFAPFFIAVIVLALCLTGRIGREAIQWCVEEGVLTKAEAVRKSRWQTILIADIISAAALYRETRRYFK